MAQDHDIDGTAERMAGQQDKGGNHFRGTVHRDVQLSAAAGRLVNIVPFNHPLTPLDLEDLRTELKNRSKEERDILMVSLGIQHDARARVDTYNRNRPVNKLHVIELRSDKKYGGIIRHEPLSAEISARREGDKLVVEVADVISPSIVQRLNLE